jgi:NAD(P)-dependent dehydrogenase (short-subunit alcohol dehydrogenase family)
MSLLCWPAELPETLQGLYDELSAGLGESDVVTLDSAMDLADALRTRDWDLAAFVVSGGSDDLLALTDLAALLRGSDGETTRRVVFVVADSFLGTDAQDLTQAGSSAGAVNLARSMAVRRGDRHRANVVCVPEAIFGTASSHRGPLRHSVDRSDIVDAGLFLLSQEARYINGQVLFVDAGRHLFSSLSA